MNEISYKAVMQTDGTISPLSFKWKNGKTCEIDRIRKIERAASLKVGGCGSRYTVTVKGKERYFFLEDGKWFVEATVYGGV